jgi:hypothetical protein
VLQILRASLRFIFIEWSNGCARNPAERFVRAARSRTAAQH